MKLKQIPKTRNLQIGDTFVQSGMTYLIIDDDFSGCDAELINQLPVWRKKRNTHY